MKIHLKLHSETLAQARAELEAFLGLERNNPTITTTTKSDAVVSSGNNRTADTEAHPNGADIASRGSQWPAPKKDRTKSAADIALGLEPEGDGEAEDEVDPEDSADTVPVENVAVPHSEAEALLADKAQLQFDFDRVLALQGRAAALGIVRGVLPPGTKTKIKDIEALPVALIPAAIAALQAAGAN